MSAASERSERAEAYSTAPGLDALTLLVPPCLAASRRFYTHQEALLSLRHISSTKLDERLIRCDLDPGYSEGRQYGRGRSGGQVRDEHRVEYDAGRGGWGAGRLREEEERKRREAEEARRKEEQEALYRNAEAEGQGAGLGGATVPGGADAEYFETEGAMRAGGLGEQEGSTLVSGDAETGAKRGRRDSDDGEDGGDEEDDAKRMRGADFGE